MMSSQLDGADDFVPRQLRKGTPMVPVVPPHLLFLPQLAVTPHPAEAVCEDAWCEPARWIEEHENETEDDYDRA